MGFLSEFSSSEAKNVASRSCGCCIDCVALFTEQAHHKLREMLELPQVRDTYCAPAPAPMCVPSISSSSSSSSSSFTYYSFASLCSPLSSTHHVLLFPPLLLVGCMGLVRHRSHKRSLWSREAKNNQDSQQLPVEGELSVCKAEVWLSPVLQLQGTGFRAALTRSSWSTWRAEANRSHVLLACRKY